MQEPRNTQPPPASAESLEHEVAAIYAAHAAELLAYGMAMAGSEETARDALQEAFLRYFVERRYGRRVQNPRAWLYRVLRNLLLDQLDSAAKKNEVVEGAEKVPDTTRSPEDRIHQAQVARQIAAMLSPREMDCVRLRAEGLTYTEISHILGLRMGTVSALLTRAHIKLRDATQDNPSLRWSAAEALYYLFRGPESYSSRH